MATLLFSALGTVFGGPFGGAIGALVGRQVDSAIIGGGSREGARLRDLSVTTSSYGTPIPRIFGTMRVPGTIVWSTDLVEHRDRQGGGKGKPSVTSYSYTASFAVILSSRPIQGIGRIWADGNLLRGAAGDLKVPGGLRIYDGSGSQPLDPLLAAAESSGMCPAYRGRAFAVFEDLNLGDFGNRIPTLTFEVIADTGDIPVEKLVDGVVDDVDGAAVLGGVRGLSCEGPLTELFTALSPAFPLDCDVSGDRLTLTRTSSAAATALPEAAIAIADDAFGAQEGFVRKRWPVSPSHAGLLRYYDVDRDYQPGLQRASGRSRAGQPTTVELPVAMAAGDARKLIDVISRRERWARQSLSWRSAELDPAIQPGSLVTVPGEPGEWRVGDWEWREGGVELTLWRRGDYDRNPFAGADPGRASTPLDAIAGATTLISFEAPWDGNGSDGAPATHAAATAESAAWSGAALFIDQGDGQLQPAGTTGRQRSIAGHAEGALGEALPHLFDRSSNLIVQLAGPDLVLADASPRSLANGANQALVGSEIIQFAKATGLGEGRWQIEGLMRGRGGTEAAIAGHQAGEPFVLLDSPTTRIDPALFAAGTAASIAAQGLGDPAPVHAAIINQGIAKKPLFPVHPVAETLPGGGLRLAWTRRARGAWTWLDSVATPLNEESESYEVRLGDSNQPIASWTVSTSELILDEAVLDSLRATATGMAFAVHQRGNRAISDPTFLCVLN